MADDFSTADLLVKATERLAYAQVDTAFYGVSDEHRELLIYDGNWNIVDAQKFVGYREVEIDGKPVKVPMFRRTTAPADTECVVRWKDGARGV